MKIFFASNLIGDADVNGSQLFERRFGVQPALNDKLQSRIILADKNSYLNAPYGCAPIKLFRL